MTDNTVLDALEPLANLDLTGVKGDIIYARNKTEIKVKDVEAANKAIPIYKAEREELETYRAKQKLFESIQEEVEKMKLSVAEREVVEAAKLLKENSAGDIADINDFFDAVRNVCKAIDNLKEVRHVTKT